MNINEERRSTVRLITLSFEDATQGFSNDDAPKYKLRTSRAAICERGWTQRHTYAIIANRSAEPANI